MYAMYLVLDSTLLSNKGERYHSFNKEKFPKLKKIPSPNPNKKKISFSQIN